MANLLNRTLKHNLNQKNMKEKHVVHYLPQDFLIRDYQKMICKSNEFQQVNTLNKERKERKT